MGSKSKIEWTDHTFNPWWGCTKVSPACDHCYAESLAERVGYSATGSQFPIWGKDEKRRFFGDKHWNDPYKWNAAAAKAGKPAFVFCASMADVMEGHRELYEHRKRLFAVIELTPWLTWILLTKRPQNFRRLLPTTWMESPRPNVIGATTVESQDYMWRAVELSKTPFALRAVSAEPMLGPLDFTMAQWTGSHANYVDLLSGGIVHPIHGLIPQSDCGKIGWIFAGGESGHGARPMHPDWARSLRDQCQEADVPFLFKQWGEYIPVTCDDSCGIPDTRESHCVWLSPAGKQWKPGTLPAGGEADFAWSMSRVGKHAAGRLLDGVEWNGFPEVKNGDR
jgi:protein gp37